MKDSTVMKFRTSTLIVKTKKMHWWDGKQLRPHDSCSLLTKTDAAAVETVVDIMSADSPHI